MHNRLLVTTRDATSSEDARRTATDYLTEYGFVREQEGRWGGGVADWFVVGGRWSGTLAGGVGRPLRGLDLAYGRDEDARLITPELYDRFLTEFEGLRDCEGFADLEYEPVSREFIGRKWLVVVDYHT